MFPTLAPQHIPYNAVTTSWENPLRPHLRQTDMNFLPKQSATIKMHLKPAWTNSGKPAKPSSSKGTDQTDRLCWGITRTGLALPDATTEVAPAFKVEQNTLQGLENIVALHAASSLSGARFRFSPVQDRKRTVFPDVLKKNGTKQTLRGVRTASWKKP